MTSMEVLEPPAPAPTPAPDPMSGLLPLGARAEVVVDALNIRGEPGLAGEVVATLLPEFERAHPGIRVDVQQLPWSAAHEKLLTAFAGDATPDICQLGNTWIPEFVALRALEPLDAFIAASSVDPRDFFDGIWDTNVVAERVYGVPWYVDTRLLFYRRDLLEAAGVLDGALLALPPDYSLVAMEVVRALIRTPLKDLLPELDPEKFWQVHRGTIVNLSHVREVEMPPGSAPATVFMSGRRSMFGTGSNADAIFIAICRG